MLQCGQNATLNHASHRFVAYSTHNNGQIANSAYFHLTAVSQSNHHASFLNVSQIVVLDQL